MRCRKTFRLPRRIILDQSQVVRLVFLFAVQNWVLERFYERVTGHDVL